MKQFKRNAVIVTVVLFVCVAAYLNWSYGKQDDIAANGTDDPLTGYVTPADNTGDQPSGGLFYEGDNGKTQTLATYFAEARLSRQQARDAAVETLATVQNASGASQEVVNAALEKIMTIATYSQTEAELETLIKSKGFSDCVVFISESGVKITVPGSSQGLSAVDVAKITEIVTTETEFTASQLKIVPVK
ncbi:MAG: SpoIIIAH-like family protein [Oscillospiraceae bacterium]|jgi:stage III sporulation protein AH|nr:SpoIIIAH-like family protein [Oscillospiraceae bacterium]